MAWKTFPCVDAGIAFAKMYAKLKLDLSLRKTGAMEPKECFYKEQFGYCWQDNEQWLFQAVDLTEKPLGEPVKVELEELVFHHDEDEELH